MECLECGGNLFKTVGVVSFESKVLGRVNVPGIAMEACDTCGSQLLFPGETDKAIDRLLRAECERIASEPFADFISLNQACGILRMTKQAFSKSKKIARGFIMGAEIDGRRFYLRESVAKFKKAGDGRFLLDPLLVASSSTFALYAGVASPATIPELSGAVAFTGEMDENLNRGVA